ncbi:MAG: hypothetical protein LBQ80_05715 [Clostridium sp.]|jgi:DNA repair protein RadC|nr:hypothetical protein [Clostridium sp.]
MPENMHENHRLRVRERFLKEGLSGFASHQVLELLLFYAIPRKDTNALAHDLLTRFGSLRRIFESSHEALRSVPGMTDNATVLLRLLPQLARRYAMEREPAHPLILDSRALRSHLAARYTGVKLEQPLLLCLDSAGRLQSTCEFQHGSSNSAGFDLRFLAEQVLRHNAAAVVLAHNHPGGSTEASAEDVEATRRAARLLKELRVRLCDHVIFADNELTSMAKDRRYAGLFI